MYEMVNYLQNICVKFKRSAQVFSCLMPFSVVLCKLINMK